ncbi:ATP-dependent DNA helicase [Syntrophomonas erecta]
MLEFNRENVMKHFAPGGKIGEIVSGYRYREEQANLAGEVADAFIDKEFLVAEVGTGVGKTFAYLLPAVLWAVQEGEKVVVSTRTRALQQQIVDKDIPDLQQIVPQRFQCVQAKGRENYLCWNKYMSILGGRKKLEPDEQNFIEAILAWAEKTKTGDRSELSLSSNLMKNWPILAADRHSCRKELCRYHEKCFRLKMMKNLQKADVIVTNHALLLSDLVMDHQILPEYHYLVVDEAHTFDRESFDKLSNRFNYHEVMDTLRFLHSRDARYDRGYLQLLRGRYTQLQEQINEIRQLVERMAGLTQEVFQVVGDLTPVEQDFARVLKTEELQEDWFNRLVEVYLDWQASTHNLISKLTDLRDELKGEEEEAELNSVLLSLRDVSDRAFMVLEEDAVRDDRILWIEYEHGKSITVASSMIQIGELLADGLFSNLDSLVMVSATLAIEKDFNFFLQRIGLGDQSERVNTLLENSPFAYEKQAHLFTVTDICDPFAPNVNQEVSSILLELMAAVHGRALVLFTSRRQLKSVAGAIRPVCGQMGVELLVQNEDGDFGTLMQRFTTSPCSWLMGVETFWEGIDLKGDLLTCVVVVRLPFRPPSEPYSSASDRSCRLKRQNSFISFMLPDAAVRFKQGVGRLIRSENDRGIIVVLDNRLQGKPYGRVFKNSIPIKNISSIKKAELAREVKKWFGNYEDFR